MIRVILLAYIILILYAYFVSEGIIFQPQKSSYKDNQDILKLQVASGIEISVMYLFNLQAEFTFLYSHGNAEDLGDMLPLLDAFYRQGFSVIAYDYQGYGTSKGTPSEKNSYKDIERVYQYLVEEKKIAPEKIIAWGRSVGAGPAVDLAYRRKLGGLVVESSFVTAFRVMTTYPLIPFDRYRNLKKIKKVKCPVLVIHGTKDVVIPFWHGEKLFQAVKSLKLSLWVEGAGHDDLFWVAGENYFRKIEEFIKLVKKAVKEIN